MDILKSLVKDFKPKTEKNKEDISLYVLLYAPEMRRDEEILFPLS